MIDKISDNSAAAAAFQSGELPSVSFSHLPQFISEFVNSTVKLIQNQQSQMKKANDELKKSEQGD